MFDEETSECVGKGINITKKILTEYQQHLDVICAPATRIYQLMHAGKIDFTINIKKTNSLPENTLFVDTPFRKIVIKLYSHKDLSLDKDVAAIKGFSYQGHKDKLDQQGFDFFEMPTSISAIQFFLKKQSGHLISYGSSWDYYVDEKKLDVNDVVFSQALEETSTHYAISNTSYFKQRLLDIFNQYALEHKVSYFNAIDY
jgi:polar amino acid transport system substrate-binding protein